MNGKKGMNPDVGKYIGVYFAFGIGSAGLVVVQTLILWIFCSIEVSHLDSIELTHYEGCATRFRVESATIMHQTQSGLNRRCRHPGSFMREWLLLFSGLQ